MTPPETLEALERLVAANVNIEAAIRTSAYIDLDIAARKALPSLISDSRELGRAKERIGALEAQLRMKGLRTQSLADGIYAEWHHFVSSDLMPDEYAEFNKKFQPPKAQS